MGRLPHRLLLPSRPRRMTLTKVDGRGLGEEHIYVLPFDITAAGWVRPGLDMYSYVSPARIGIPTTRV
jgi:DUF1365 family protein